MLLIDEPYNGAAAVELHGRLYITLFRDGRSDPATVARFRDAVDAADAFRALVDGEGPDGLDLVTGPYGHCLAVALRDCGRCLATFDGRARGGRRVALTGAPLENLPETGARFVLAYQVAREIVDTARRACGRR